MTKPIHQPRSWRKNRSLTIIAGSTSAQHRANAEIMRAASRLWKLLARAAQINVMKRISVAESKAGRVPKCRAMGTQQKTYREWVVKNEGFTPRPRSKILQLITPSTVVFKSVWNSSIKRTIAVLTAPIIQPASIAKRLIVVKAQYFFQRGQLRGSLGSSVGWGTRTISEFSLLLKWWEAANVRRMSMRGDTI